VSRYQKGKTNLDFTEGRDSEWQWHQLGHMQVCTSHQTDNHVSTSPLSFFTGRMPFLSPNQQRQSTEGIFTSTVNETIIRQQYKCTYATVYIYIYTPRKLILYEAHSKRSYKLQDDINKNLHHCNME